MKKAAMALWILLMLIIGIFYFSSPAEANPYMLKPKYCHISIRSPQNETYYSIPVLLNFTTKNSHFPEYSYFYTIDGQSIQSGTWVENVQILGNETITNDTAFPYIEYSSWGWAYLPSLNEGTHNLTLYSVNHDNNYGDIETIHFNVEAQPKVDSFPSTLIIASASLIAAVCFGFVIYFKKFHGNKSL